MKSAAQRDVGNGANQIPGMSSFVLRDNPAGIYTSLPGGATFQYLNCFVPGNSPSGYVFPLPTTFPYVFKAATLTPQDAQGDITISPTYLIENNGAIRIFNPSGGDNSISVICMGH
ncbi:hypothetical protein DJ035_09945 [Salmonella enterica]|nr:hypothetical protein [Salmonella enterica subsp. enterica serovar Stanleyville]EAM3048076.1 hypothetical protein [Salmonella enterica]EAP0102005.1 hypothetical protein [Salmonella enterica]EBR7951530.1 hypothetical protein [Salmonella enterica subsp. enterica serovar Stanleyville]EBS3593235.1 hypothetical protein [Salmonella enterica subsp. enterica serovar Stanleyville]